jgi:glyoxylate/hydroxypyruvate reductase A
MAVLLISDYGADAKQWRRELEQCAGPVDFRVWPDVGAFSDIEAILIDHRMGSRGGYGQFPCLRWVGFLGHGAGVVLRDSTLHPDVLVTRLKDPAIAKGLTEYVVQAVTTHHLKARDYARLQGQALWQRLEVPPSVSQVVVVLGLGFIGLRVATALRDLGFQTCGWSASPKTIAGMECLHGRAALEPALSRGDYVVAVLPETEQTIGLMDRRAFGAMKRGSFIVNVGRGSLIVEEDLVEALDDGQVSGAQLDVFCVEPLPADSPLWRHPKVIVTPHTGGPAGEDAHMAEVAENYRRLLAGEPLTNLVGRCKGY